MRENIENKVQFEHCNLHLCQGIQVFPESPEVLGDPKTKHEKNISHVKTITTIIIKMTIIIKESNYLA